jgi:hypothetical protein
LSSNGAGEPIFSIEITSISSISRVPQLPVVYLFLPKKHRLSDLTHMSFMPIQDEHNCCTLSLPSNKNSRVTWCVQVLYGDQIVNWFGFSIWRWYISRCIAKVTYIRTTCNLEWREYIAMQFYTTYVEVEGWFERFAVQKDDSFHCDLNSLGGHGRLLIIALAEVN